MEVEEKGARSPARMVLTQAANGGAQSRRKGAEGTSGSATDAWGEGSIVVVAGDAAPFTNGEDGPAEVSSDVGSGLTSLRASEDGTAFLKRSLGGTARHDAPHGCGGRPPRGSPPTADERHHIPSPDL